MRARIVSPVASNQSATQCRRVRFAVARSITGVGVACDPGNVQRQKKAEPSRPAGFRVMMPTHTAPTMTSRRPDVSANVTTGRFGSMERPFVGAERQEYASRIARHSQNDASGSVRFVFVMLYKAPERTNMPQWPNERFGSLAPRQVGCWRERQRIELIN
jgi:hypothetical protein